MQETISAISDIFIKFLLGSERNNDLLLSFINAVLADAGFKTIVKAEIKNPFSIKSIKDEKESILDVKATDETGRQ
jgi:predicted transposase/invertase (TIGR01784 family)